MKREKLIKVFLSSALLLCTIVSVTLFTMISEAEELVLIEEKENCELQYLSLDGRHNENVWEHKGSLTQSGGTYTLKSNGWAPWFSADNCAMGYVDVPFDYSKEAQLTVETTMTSFSGSEENAGAGLMIRTGTKTDSACVMFHFRPGAIYSIYRMIDGGSMQIGRVLNTSTSSLYPVTFKLVVIKGENKVDLYYKTSGDYVKFGSTPFVYDKNLSVGIADYSALESQTVSAVFSSFSYRLEAPEGYSVGEGGSGGDVEIPEEEENILPEDYPVAEDVLLSETFTDGSMFDGEESITNPIWKSNAFETDIITDENNMNRYLSEYMQSNVCYTAGDQGWTDYELSSKFRFTVEYTEQTANQLIFIVRYTDIDQYGYRYYYTGFRTDPNTGKHWLEIGVVRSSRTTYNDRTVLASMSFDYLSEDFLSDWHTISVQAFDNVITVFLDGTEMLSYTDNDRLCNTDGSIGFMTNYAAVDIDDIIVTKMVDLLGGDYDNHIGGNWNKEIPAYLQEFEDKKMPY